MNDETDAVALARLIKEHMEGQAERAVFASDILAAVNAGRPRYTKQEVDTVLQTYPDFVWTWNMRMGSGGQPEAAWRLQDEEEAGRKGVFEDILRWMRQEHSRYGPSVAWCLNEIHEGVNRSLERADQHYDISTVRRALDDYRRTFKEVIRPGKGVRYWALNLGQFLPTKLDTIMAEAMGLAREAELRASLMRLAEHIKNGTFAEEWCPGEGVVDVAIRLLKELETARIVFQAFDSVSVQAHESVRGQAATSPEEPLRVVRSPRYKGGRPVVEGTVPPPTCHACMYCRPKERATTTGPALFHCIIDPCRGEDGSLEYRELGHWVAVSNRRAEWCRLTGGDREPPTMRACVECFFYRVVAGECQCWYEAYATQVSCHARKLNPILAAEVVPLWCRMPGEEKRVAEAVYAFMAGKRKDPWPVDVIIKRVAELHEGHSVPLRLMVRVLTSDERFVGCHDMGEGLNGWKFALSVA